MKALLVFPLCLSVCMTAKLSDQYIVPDPPAQHYSAVQQAVTPEPLYSPPEQPYSPPEQPDSNYIPPEQPYSPPEQPDSNYIPPEQPDSNYNNQKSSQPPHKNSDSDRIIFPPDFQPAPWHPSPKPTPKPSTEWPSGDLSTSSNYAQSGKSTPEVNNSGYVPPSKVDKYVPPVKESAYVPPSAYQ